MCFHKCKKGSMEDMFVLIMIIFVGALSLGIGYQILTTLTNTDVVSNFTTTVEGADWDQTLDKMDSIFLNLDLLSVFFVVMVFISILVLSFLVPSHPIFMILGFILFIFSIFLSVIFSNMYQTFAETSILTSSATSFPITNHILTNLPFYIVPMGILTMIVLYGRSRSDLSGQI